MLYVSHRFRPPVGTHQSVLQRRHGEKVCTAQYSWIASQEPWTAFAQGCLDSCSGWIIVLWDTLVLATIGERSLHQGYRTHRFRFGCGEERSRGSRFIVPLSWQWHWLRHGELFCSRRSAKRTQTASWRPSP